MSQVSNARIANKIEALIVRVGFQCCRHCLIRTTWQPRGSCRHCDSGPLAFDLFVFFVVDNDANLSPDILEHGRHILNERRFLLSLRQLQF